MQFANGIHIDIGDKKGVATGPYYFYDTGANVGTALTSTSAGKLAAIPGYNQQVPALALQPGFEGSSATYAGAPGDNSAPSGSAAPTPGNPGRDTALAIIIPAALIAMKIMGA